MRKPRVDQDSCISCGMCVSICPEVFQFNGDGKSEPRDLAEYPEDLVQQAIDSCPVQCISWES